MSRGLGSCCPTVCLVGWPGGGGTVRSEPLGPPPPLLLILVFAQAKRSLEGIHVSTSTGAKIQ